MTAPAAARIALPPIAPDAFYRRDPAARVVSLGGATMGTTWSVRYVPGRAPPFVSSAVETRPEAVEPALIAALDRVIAQMSQWEPASTLSRFNRSQVGAWQVLQADLTQVLDAALDIGRRSGGAFDPAGGHLTDLWGFGPPGPRVDVPSDAEVTAALARSGAAAIERSALGTRRTADVALDLSGIAKGFAVDALAAALRGAGVNDFLVEVGGEFVGAGIRPDGQPWWVALESPPGLTLAPLRIAAHGIAIATSGDYCRFVTAGDRRLGHTIDPRTGRPIANGVISASVVAADCMSADGWATALTVLGADAGIATADREGLAARIVTADGGERLSAALRAMLDG